MGSACTKVAGGVRGGVSGFRGSGLDLHGQSITSRDARDLLVKALGSGVRVNLDDNVYTVLARSEVEGFLEADRTDSITYSKETYDCDDFAVTLMGRSREWFAANSKQSRNEESGSLALGFLTGDIRDDGKDENNDTARPHAVNVVIARDDDTGALEVWIIEPQNDKWFKPSGASTFWFAML